jgi:hypothetical protein
MSSHESSVAPILWRVRDQTLGAVDAIVLGDQDNDDWRVGVTIVRNGDEPPDVDAQVIYPCRACGWASACGDHGEDCHS